jgi:hypothetical protein
MKEVLIILSPPRSFSSVISTMIGEHPQLYGFPELHLFSSTSVGEMVQHKVKGGKAAPPGLIRTLAQELYGVQTTETVLKATDWLLERQHWTNEELFNHLLDLISPKMGVEKSPQTAKKSRYLERTYEWFPNAYYLHLTRHPLTSRKSLQEFGSHRAEKEKDQLSSLRYSLVDGFFIWYQFHNNILQFTNTLPNGQVMRIKGEDLLSETDVYLPQIAQWLGLRSDSEAVEAMKHPEKSPYAYVGPPPYPGGNDPKFMRNPSLRGGKIREPSLKDFWDKQAWDWPSEGLQSLSAGQEVGLDSKEDFAEAITKLTHLMGYQ